jgi:hypothetical protein
MQTPKLSQTPKKTKSVSGPGRGTPPMPHNAFYPPQAQQQPHLHHNTVAAASRRHQVQQPTIPPPNAYQYQHILQQQAYQAQIQQQYQQQYQQHVQQQQQQLIIQHQHQQQQQQQQQHLVHQQQQHLHQQQHQAQHQHQQLTRTPSSGALDTTTTVPTDPRHENLIARLREQVEYYLGPLNLSHDSFIVGLMDINFFVPIRFIANFNRVKTLTQDLSLILHAVSISPQLELDAAGTCVRPRTWQSLVRQWTDKGWVATSHHHAQAQPTATVQPDSQPSAPTAAPGANQGTDPHQQQMVLGQSTGGRLYDAHVCPVTLSVCIFYFSISV